MAGSESFSISEYASLRQRIVLLHMLNTFPASPTEVPLEQLQELEAKAPRRILKSIQHEKTFTTAIAFLAATTDDPRRVVAACVEEDYTNRLLKVRLASNWGDLETVRCGLMRMARILEDVASKEKNLRHDETTQQSLLREAVQLNHNRIMTRLRSVHAVSNACYRNQKKSRPKILGRLLPAIDLIPGLLCPDVRSEAETLSRLFQELEQMDSDRARGEPGRDLLAAMVTLCRSSQLRHVLPEGETAPVGLESGTWSKLKITIAKLGHYFATCECLLYIVQKHTRLRRIEVDICRYQHLPLPKMNLDPATNSMVIGLRASRADVLRESARTIQNEIIDKASSKCPIHAEIQLLMYYEEHDRLLPPRIISSSKQACFMCNLFFKIHGRFITPSTHGRLYKGWGLPLPLMQQLGLDGKLMDLTRSIDATLARESFTLAKSLAPPNESAIFPSVIGSASTAIASSSTIKPPRPQAPQTASISSSSLSSITQTLLSSQPLWLCLSRNGPVQIVQTPHLRLTLSYGDANALQPHYWVRARSCPHPASIGTVAAVHDIKPGSQKTYDLDGRDNEVADATLHIRHAGECIELLYTCEEQQT